MIQVTINGKNHEFPGPKPLPDYVSSLKLTSTMIAIAYNGDVLRREEWDQVILSDGDTVEVVRAVGGG
jgi:thiamine biosynthesis protein ThiS